MGNSPETKEERNWALWREYRAGNVTLTSVGAKHGITRGRVSDLVARHDKQVAVALRRMMNAHAPPLNEHMRKALLGVEFTFMDDLVFPYEELHMNGGPWQQFDGSTWFKIEIGASDE
jgi:hypothetical protein